jgi:hypothetical protein
MAISLECLRFEVNYFQLVRSSCTGSELLPSQKLRRLDGLRAGEPSRAELMLRYLHLGEFDAFFRFHRRLQIAVELQFLYNLTGTVQRFLFGRLDG